PDYSLINLKKYFSLCVQYSRGCPFNCEFCDVVRLNGRVPRYKTKRQIIKELENLYHLGWRENIFFVDDNFIGNRIAVKKELLPAIIEWQKKRRSPFGFITQASINLADDQELIDLMAKAGFATVFVGIETPNPESLRECNKLQNQNRDLLASVRRIQKSGLEVQGGFIVGFDHDTPAIFKRQIEFIQKSGIVTAMVGLLGVLPKTCLYERLKKAGRLIKNASGDNTLVDLNFIPKMKKNVLLKGYRDLLDNLYSPKNYYQRVINFLREFKPQLRRQNLSRLRFYHLKALFASLWLLGIKYKGRRYYWKLFFWSLFRRPKTLPQVIGFSITGLHFRRLYYQS
ncbi:B12-binding domain-containing radical SAM protein, partial [Candidatus Shapirobacteria bacterium CG_4_9_14_0_2_um_filter_39_11]